jgi:hypothetical protein
MNSRLTSQNCFWEVLHTILRQLVMKNIPNDHKICQMTTKYAKWPQNTPNDHKIYQMTTKYTKWPQNIPNDHKICILNCHKIYQVSVHKVFQMAITFTTMSIPRPQKLYPNWYFWYETTYTVWQLCCGAVDGYGIAILPGFEHVATIVRCDTAWPLRWRVFGQVFSFNLER